MRIHLHKLRPRIYGSIYLALIPLFALIYWNLDDQFYQSTAATEAAGRLLTKQTESELTIVAKSFFDEAKRHKIGFPITDPVVLGLESTGRIISFRTHIQTVIPKSFSRNRHQLRWEIMIPPLPPTWPSTGISGDKVELSVRIDSIPRFMTMAVTPTNVIDKRSYDTPIGPIRGHIHPATEGGDTDGWIDGTLSVPSKSYEILERFHAMHSGSLKSVDGGFGRALYCD